jgi:histidyl-tRNA synthetase
MPLKENRMIEPKVLKGFRDSLPEEELLRRTFMSRIEQALRSFGYVPIDTPALEYKEVLTGKSGDETDKQVFTFQDKGERDVGLRFDLTVPLARFVAANEQHLVFPFKRYHIAKVWRGEKPQRGRYREFYQADFDIIGADSVSSDVEILSLVMELLVGLGVQNFKIHANDRSLVHAIFEKEGLLEFESRILAIVDKIYKIGAKAVEIQLDELIGAERLAAVSFLTKGVTNPAEFFADIKRRFGFERIRLEEVYGVFQSRGLAHQLVIDPAITRGLDYYTGLVYETFLDDSMSLGSISSGGRYANLTSLFSKNAHSGIGGSIGLDRLLAYLTEKGAFVGTQAHADVLVINFSEQDLGRYCDVASEMRKAGLSVEVYPAQAKLKKQFSYADAKRMRFAVIMGEDEIRAKKIKVKNLAAHEEKEFSSVQEFLDTLK